MPPKDKYPLRKLTPTEPQDQLSLPGSVNYTQLEFDPLPKKAGYLSRTSYGDKGAAKTMRKDYVSTATSSKPRGTQYAMLDHEAMGQQNATVVDEHPSQIRRASPTLYEGNLPEGFDPIAVVIKLITNAQKGGVSFSGAGRERKFSFSHQQDGGLLLEADYTIPYIKKMIADQSLTRGQAVRILTLCENFKEVNSQDLLTIKRLIREETSYLGRVSISDTHTLAALLAGDSELLDFHVKYGSSLVGFKDGLQKYNPQTDFGKNIKAFLIIYDAAAHDSELTITPEIAARAATYAILKGDEDQLRVVLNTVSENLELHNLFQYLGSEEKKELGIDDQFQPLTPALLATMCGADIKIIRQCCFPPTSEVEEIAKIVNIAIANGEIAAANEIITNYGLRREQLDMELIESLTPMQVAKNQVAALRLLQARTAEIIYSDDVVEEDKIPTREEALQALKIAYQDERLTRVDIESDDQGTLFTLYKEGKHQNSYVINISLQEQTATGRKYQVICSNPERINPFTIENVKDITSAMQEALGGVLRQKEQNAEYFQQHQVMLQRWTREIEERQREQEETEKKENIGNVVIHGEDSDTKIELDVSIPYSARGTTYNDKTYKFNITHQEGDNYKVTYKVESIYTKGYADQEKRGRQKEVSKETAFTIDARNIAELKEECIKAVRCYNIMSSEVISGGYPLLVIRELTEPSTDSRDRRDIKGTTYVNTRSGNREILQEGTIKARCFIEAAICIQRREELAPHHLAGENESILLPETIEKEEKEAQQIIDITQDFNQSCAQPSPKSVTYTRDKHYNCYGTIIDSNRDRLTFEYNCPERSFTLKGGSLTEDIQLLEAYDLLTPLKEAWKQYTDKVKETAITRPQHEDGRSRNSAKWFLDRGTVGLTWVVRHGWRKLARRREEFTTEVASTPEYEAKVKENPIYQEAPNAEELKEALSHKFTSIKITDITKEDQDNGAFKYTITTAKSVYTLTIIQKDDAYCITTDTKETEYPLDQYSNYTDALVKELEGEMAKRIPAFKTYEEEEVKTWLNQDKGLDLAVRNVYLTKSDNTYTYLIFTEEKIEAAAYRVQITFTPPSSCEVFNINNNTLLAHYETTDSYTALIGGLSQIREEEKRKAVAQQVIVKEKEAKGELEEIELSNGGYIDFIETQGTFTVYSASKKIVHKGKITKKEEVAGEDQFGFEDTYQIAYTPAAGDNKVEEEKSASSITEALKEWGDELAQQSDRLPKKVSVVRRKQPPVLIYITEELDLKAIEEAYYVLASGTEKGTLTLKFKGNTVITKDFSIEAGMVDFHDGSPAIKAIPPRDTKETSHTKLISAIKQHPKYTKLKAEQEREEQVLPLVTHNVSDARRATKAVELSKPEPTPKVNKTFNVMILSDEQDEGKTVHIGLVSSGERGIYTKEKGEEIQSSDLQIKVTELDHGENNIVRKTYNISGYGFSSKVYDVKHIMLKASPESPSLIEETIAFINAIKEQLSEQRQIRYHATTGKQNQMEAILETVNLSQQIDKARGSKEFTLPENLKDSAFSAQILTRMHGVSFSPARDIAV